MESVFFPGKTALLKGYNCDLIVSKFSYLPSIVAAGSPATFMESVFFPENNHTFQRVQLPP
jgi:hypothetical protein